MLTPLRGIATFTSGGSPKQLDKQQKMGAHTTFTEAWDKAAATIGNPGHGTPLPEGQQTPV